MKKRWTALLLALTMTLALTACGGEQPSGEEDAQESVEETVDDAQTETGEDMTETGTEEAEDEQAQEPQLGEQPADTTEKPQTGSSPADTNEKPQSQPVEKPSTEQKPAQEQKPAEEQKPAASADLSAFAADLAASQTNWPGMMALEGEALDTYYPGLSALSPKQCVVQMAMISASAVEIALVEVASSADVETVKGIFQSRIDYQLGDGENPAACCIRPPWSCGRTTPASSPTATM